MYKRQAKEFSLDSKKIIDILNKNNVNVSNNLNLVGEKEREVIASIVNNKDNNKQQTAKKNNQQNVNHKNNNSVSYTHLRTLDLDIIFYDDDIISEDDLIVPHPDMKNRDFVLKPLMQIAPYKLHPVYRKTISDMYAELMAKKQ